MRGHQKSQRKRETKYSIKKKEKKRCHQKNISVFITKICSKKVYNCTCK